MIVTESAPWLMCPKPNPKARMRLFCFPYAGGGAQVYQYWGESLSETVEVFPLQLPGRGTRWGEAPYTRLIPLVQTISRVLLPLLSKPFAFFGHSMGSLIGFELARELRRTYALAPDLLFVSGRAAPHMPEKRPPVHRLPDEKFVAHLQKLNGTPSPLLKDSELMSLMLPVLRADFAVCETYMYRTQPPLNCPISVFGGTGDTEIDDDELEGWREHTSGAFSLQKFDGDHFFIHQVQPLVLREVSRKLMQLLSC